VAAGIFAIAVAWAMGTFIYGARAGDRTDRVDDYREMRIIFNRISRDLQDSTRLRLPAYDSHSFKMVMLDSRDREVTYSMQEEGGAELTAEPPAGDTKRYRVVRAAGPPGDVKSETLRQTTRIHWLRFTRLGERLLGLTVKMLPREPDKPGATFTATMSFNRVIL
jgi:hypothetical protein